MTDRETPHVLLVEDNPGDARLFQLAAVGADVSVTIDVATDHGEAMAVLREGAGPDGGPPVDVVVLDLDLGASSGADVLRAIREDPSLETLPVLVLSSQTAATQEMYDLGANAFLEKRTDYEGTRRLVEAVAAFWFEVVDLPEA